jgi:hypothetical protein
MTIISQYADQDKTTNVLQNNNSLMRFAQEFCHEFGMKVLETNQNNAVRIVTPNGLDVGALGIYRHTSESENHYRVYMPCVINKEKASKRSGRNERDADKLPTLFRTLRKNKEIPSEDKLVKSFRTPIRYALSRITNVPEPRVSITPQATLTLIQKILGKSEYVDPAHYAEVDEAYEKYLKAKLKSDDANKNLERITKGFHLVGIMRSTNEDYYLVTEGTATGVESDDVLIQPNVTRYKTLADSPLAATAMMIRTYAEGKGYTDDNDLKLPWTDRFYSDLDIGTGYQSRELGLWVVIPKHGE